MTWHPKAQKDLKALDKPVQKQVLSTIDALLSKEPTTLAQTHPLSGPLKGWTATKVSRGHRITHQMRGDTLHIGHIGLHNYDDAIRRLTTKDEPEEKVRVYRGLYLSDEPETYEGEVRRRFDHREPVGRHWTTDPEVAKAYAGGLLRKDFKGAGVVLHGEVDARHVMPHEEIPSDRHVLSPDSFEKEVHLSPGTPVKVHQTSVHWHHVDDEGGEFEPEEWWDEAHEKHDPPLRVHAAGKEEETKEILRDLLKSTMPRYTPPTDEEKAQADTEHQERVRKHQEWQAARPGINPGEDIASHQMGKEYPHAEWVPIEVAKHFREHDADQHSGSEEVVHGIHQQLAKGRGLTDPLMLLHHNESQRASLGEGNHRLHAMERAGWSHVPMRVVRMYDSEANRGKGKRIPYEWARPRRNWEGFDRGRTPEMCKPSDVLAPHLFGHSG